MLSWKKEKYLTTASFFDAVALTKSYKGLHPTAIGNTFRSLSAKLAGCHGFDSQQARYSHQVGVGTKRSADVAPCVFLTRNFQRTQTLSTLSTDTTCLRKQSK